MINNLIINSATVDDIDFIIDTIIESDKSSANVISACNIFSISEEEYRSVLKQILLEDFPNSEYSLSGFLVARVDGEKVGALCSWVENADGISNAIIKSSLLMSFIEKEKLVSTGRKLEIINGMSFERKPNCIQIEYGYVIAPRRRKKIFTQLVLSSLKKHINFEAGVTNAETVLFEKNINSFDAFEKLQFKVKNKKTFEEKDVFNIFPYDTKVLMNIDLENKPDYFEKFNYLLQ